jgi:hypothetical protein
MRAIAETLNRRLNLPVRSVTAQETPAAFGCLAIFAGPDIPASSAQTRSKLSWKPIRPGLFADLEQLATARR